MLRRGSSLILILAFLSVYGMGCASERGDEASTSRGPQSAASPSESDSALSDSLLAGTEDDDLAEIRPAPPYSVGTGNNRFRLADHRGSVVVLNFWATWNQASVEGMDAMSSIHEELSPEGVVVVGIMQDEGGQTALDAWEAEHDVAYPLYPDPHHSASSVFGDMEFLPVTVIVDREGMIRERHTGKLTEDELLDLLGPILIEADEPLADSTLPADTAEVLAIRPTQVPDLIADG
ncbi:MAG: TlpA disulfide reductase family protein, partial [Rubricoccaceae bacterium]|nr:TlpA disulfide reductase family protein [Rubricoccaceae bacterium]